MVVCTPSPIISIGTTFNLRDFFPSYVCYSMADWAGWMKSAPVVLAAVDKVLLQMLRRK